MDSGKLIESNGHSNGTDHHLQISPSHLHYNYFPSEPQDSGLLDYWHILVKRKFIVIATFAVIALATAFVTFRTTKLYQAISRVAVYRETPAVLDFKDGAPLDTEDFDYTVAIETQVRIMQGDSLALEVAKALGWDQELVPT